LEIFENPNEDFNHDDLKKIFIESTLGKDEIPFNDDFGNIFFEIGSNSLKDDQTREWFNFKDGISNPRFFTNPDKEKSLKKLHKFEPPSPFELVLRKDRLSSTSLGCGSFVVFLKLQQHPENFEKFTENIAEKLNSGEPFGQFKNNPPDNVSPEEVGSWIIGRTKDGKPLMPSSDQHTREFPANNFNYNADIDGELCPLHAHIRKANPRNGNEMKRIVRRGKLYGTHSSEKKGLLFLSYQSNLLHFEDLINRSIYSSNQGNSYVGKDPLFTEPNQFAKGLKFKNKYGKLVKNVYPITEKPLITFRGGQYFFAPSISFFKDNLRNYMKQ
jgi:Dyp-type peroxidase family